MTLATILLLHEKNYDKIWMKDQTWVQKMVKEGCELPFD
jgi:hypothetical protein